VKASSTLTVALLLLVLFFIQGVFFVGANTETYDEAMHLAAGYSYLARRDFRLEPQNPPLIKEYLALPLFLAYWLPFNPDPQHWRDAADYLVGHDFLYRSRVPADKMIALSRLVNLFLGTCLIALTGWWANRLWGGRGAILAMALASLEPNLIAHSSLVTTDIGVTLFVFLSLYLLWEYLRFPQWRLLVATGLVTGMALASKFSAVLLLPIMGLIVAVSPLVGEPHLLLPLKRNQESQRYRFVQSAAVLVTIFFCAFLILSAAYWFQGFEPWLAGFKRFRTLAQVGQPAFFLEEYSYEGWWSYFAVAFLIKTPIGSLILIAAALVFYRAGSPLGRRDAAFLLLPVVTIFLAMTQAKVNIGARHILPVYPFMFVVAARLATLRFHRPRLAELFIGVAVLLTAISALRIAPHQLAYFNEIVGGPDEGYRYLLDSNLDWGQALKGVKRYMEQEKLPIIYLSYFGTAPASYYGIRYQFVPGSWPLDWPPPAERVPADAPRKILAISANNLQDLATSYDPLFHWLRVRQPIAKIGYSIFVYDLTRDQEGLAKLEETYSKAGINIP
jgi:hypothetical protein